MATANVKNFCLEMEIPEISKLDKIWSQEILIHGIPWKVLVCKEVVPDAEQTLGVYLCCAKKDKSPNWSLWGKASFTLLPFSDDVNPIERHTTYLPPFIFDVFGPGHGKANFIKWNDLFDPDKKLVKDDTINLEIKVAAENPNVPKRCRLNFEGIQKCCDNSDHATFRLMLTNVLNLMAVRSPLFTLHGLSWCIQISKMRSSHLGVLLQLEDKSKNEPRKMTMTMKLISSKKDVQPIEKCITKQYPHGRAATAVDVILWDELVKPENGFVNSNSITLEVKMQANEPEDETPTPAAKRAKLDSQNDDELLKLECPICLKCIRSQDLAVTTCGHMFCFECIKKAITTRTNCPVCNKAVRSYGLRQIYLPSVN